MHFFLMQNHVGGNINLHPIREAKEWMRALIILQGAIGPSPYKK